MVNEKPCVVVDMMQVRDDPDPPSPATATTAAASSAVKKVPMKILDPATRDLEAGILQAMQRGDFNRLSTALIQGGAANHQLPMEKGGYTALMAAAAKGNLRMVKRLLLSGVDPSLRDHQVRRRQTASTKTSCCLTLTPSSVSLLLSVYRGEVH